MPPASILRIRVWHFTETIHVLYSTYQTTEIGSRKSVLNWKTGFDRSWKQTPQTPWNLKSTEKWILQFPILFHRNTNIGQHTCSGKTALKFHVIHTIKNTFFTLPTYTIFLIFIASLLSSNSRRTVLLTEDNYNMNYQDISVFLRT